MTDLVVVRDLAIAIDIILMLWFYRLRWFKMFSVTAVCIVASLIAG